MVAPADFIWDIGQREHHIAYYVAKVLTVTEKAVMLTPLEF
jgi:hypothetical protein